jgi:hypothetical protein
MERRRYPKTMILVHRASNNKKYSSKEQLSGINPFVAKQEK